MKNLILTAAMIVLGLGSTFAGNITDLETETVEIFAKRTKTTTISNLGNQFGANNEKALVYSNNQHLTIDFMENDAEFEIFIYNQNGAMISFYQGGAEERVILEMDSFKTGKYFVKIKNAYGFDQTAEVAIK